MSVLVERSMGELNEEKKTMMFPLFQKGSKPKVQTPKDTSQEISELASDQPDAVPKKTAPRGPAKRTKLPGLAESLDSGEQTNSTSSSSKSSSHAELLEVDPNNSRRKRQRTASPEGKGLSTETEVAELGATGHKAKRGGVNGLKQPKLAQKSAKAQPTRGSSVSEGGKHPETPREFGGSSTTTAFFIGNEDTSSTKPKPASRQPLALGQGIQQDASSAPRAGPDSIPLKTGEDKPKKVLRLNPKTGTIGSPPMKKNVPASELIVPKPTKSGGKKPKSKVVTIRYGQGQHLPSSIGEKIIQIFNTSPSNSKPRERTPTTSKPPKTSAPKTFKPIHPLFLGKAPANAPSPQREASSGAEIFGLAENIEATTQPRARPHSCEKGPSPKNTSVPFSAFGSSTKIVKFSGAIEPAWPWQGMVHIRGYEDLSKSLGAAGVPLSLMSRAKKSKYQAVGISATEDIIETLASNLSIKSVVKSIQEINPDEYPSIPQCLRVPAKFYESGHAIQKRVCAEVKARLTAPKAIVESSSEDGVQSNDKILHSVHPALAKVYGSIATSMSAFDKGQCEPHAWVHKYSPKSAAEVLQTGREALILKSWLEALTVQSVEAGFSGQGPATSRPEVSGKRKRKSKKLDDFVISTDEEDNDMDEITEPEDETPSGSQGQPKRTVIKNKDVAALASKGSKVSNAVVVSGPHGCGKTAAIYAVAKELGFEVFEINSSSRRSGKDILERVGDMTRNHQVQRSTTIVKPNVVDEDSERIDNALADDLKSGRQGTMISFFKPKQASIPKSKPKPKVKETPAQNPDTSTDKTASTLQVVIPDAAKNSLFPKLPAKKQKQSLILIEEADVIYREDTQFWGNILSLIATSKRPIVITCNDESLLPMADLNLYAIIRMVSPPLDLAVDYMLLVAACEGHVIKRDAIKGLYETRNSDLRASLMELNFWCQFAIGDVKGGLEWYYPRWPTGNDVDECGNTIRVVSEGTYEAGMGWLSQDFLESPQHYLDIEEETLHEAWDWWQLDLGDWERNIPVKSWAEKVQDLSSGKKDDLAALSMYADFAEFMSVADLCSGGTFAPDNQIALDVSFPTLSAKARDDYTLGHELKEAPVLVDYNTLGKDISLYMKSRARKLLHVDQHIHHNFEVPTELDHPSEAEILRLIRNQVICPEKWLTRYDFSLAFDPISSNEKYVWSTTLEASTFDRTMTLIVEDMAPYVRSIVAYDARLQEDRLKLSNLMSEGGRKGKRMRTTRAAMSALEGGARKTTRRDRYFPATLNHTFVLKTGMPSWIEASLVTKRSSETATGSRRSSKASLEEESKAESEKDEVMESSP